jgi:hypothetical protein
MSEFSPLRVGDAVSSRRARKTFGPFSVSERVICKFWDANRPTWEDGKALVIRNKLNDIARCAGGERNHELRGVTKSELPARDHSSRFSP